jgi:hypothetical protein
MAVSLWLGRPVRVGERPAGDVKPIEPCTLSACTGGKLVLDCLIVLVWLVSKP